MHKLIAPSFALLSARWRRHQATAAGKACGEIWIERAARAVAHLTGI
jgi:hypothetical protein